MCVENQKGDFLIVTEIAEQANGIAEHGIAEHGIAGHGIAG